jgi:hypothetical protein
VEIRGSLQPLHGFISPKVSFLTTKQGLSEAIPFPGAGQGLPEPAKHCAVVAVPGPMATVGVWIKVAQTGDILDIPYFPGIGAGKEAMPRAWALHSRSWRRTWASKRRPSG